MQFIAECDLKKKTVVNSFEKINVTIPLNISLFTTSKIFSIYNLSFLFISSQKYIKLSDIKIYKIVFKGFFFKKVLYFRVYISFVEF